jgi:hypothetical protein
MRNGRVRSAERPRAAGAVEDVQNEEIRVIQG